MILPCMQCINPKSCLYRCRVTGKDDPTCFDCIVYKEFEVNDETIRGLKNEVLRHKEKADKYDEIINAYADSAIKTVMKALINTL